MGYVDTLPHGSKTGVLWVVGMPKTKGKKVAIRIPCFYPIHPCSGVCSLPPVLTFLGEQRFSSASLLAFSYVPLGSVRSY